MTIVNIPQAKAISIVPLIERNGTKTMIVSLEKRRMKILKRKARKLLSQVITDIPIIMIIISIGVLMFMAFIDAI